MANYEDRRKESEEEEECLYKTKVIQFLGRSIPIILQNDNGPCPLLAICNVLLLKNHLNLSLDAAEISLPKLLSLVAERLIDSNSNVQNKDAGYMENQQQNISDAIDLLPRLATGIDVNVLFTKINDFEFTRECAIFDLLDIGLYHGWIVDPQDTDTAAAIGLKSYNTLTAELVALETRNIVGEDKSTLEEDSVDFAAATTATLGVPSPSLSRGISFDDPPVSVSCDQRGRKGDVMEAEELMRALILSRDQITISADESLSPGTNLSNLSTNSVESVLVKSSGSGVVDSLKLHTVDEYQRSQPDSFVSQVCNVSSSCNHDGLSSEIISQDNGTSLSKIAARNHLDDSISKECEDSISSDLIENRIDTLVHKQTTPFHFPETGASTAGYAYQDQMHCSVGDQPALQTSLEDNSESLIHFTPTDNLSDRDSPPVSGPVAPNADSPPSDVRRDLLDFPNGVSSSLEGSEPIYEGEERILDSGLPNYENREPMYEGEMILAEQADRGAEGDTSSIHPKDEITQQQWELIRNFLKNNASQLTIYGLFCLQEGLKERELCVFFRNNHFSTMFKFNDELYLLVTDQGYINQPDLVWEKLNEVNGDTVFMTGNFKDFKAENQVNDQWDEQNVMTSTADYLASIDNTSSAGSTLNSDLQLAIALQQQEFEQQPQRQQPQSQQSSVSSRPRLVTGPQTPRTNTSSSKQESKTKDKCVIM